MTTLRNFVKDNNIVNLQVRPKTFQSGKEGATIYCATKDGETIYVNFFNETARISFAMMNWSLKGMGDRIMVDDIVKEGDVIHCGSIMESVDDL